jgi:hypothetical protein
MPRKIRRARGLVAGARRSERRRQDEDFPDCLRSGAANDGLILIDAGDGPKALTEARSQAHFNCQADTPAACALRGW